MNEPKRRGRPPKALTQALSDVEAKSKDPAKGNEVYEHIHSRSDAHDIAKAYAQRVWDGQSVSLPRNERLERVRKALEGQGLSMEGVEL